MQTQTAEIRTQTAEYFHQKAKQCRRAAGAMLNQNDPVVANLLALAVEFEAWLCRLKKPGPSRSSS